MLRAALFTLATAVAVPVALASPVVAADASLPTKYTTYRDARIETSEFSGSVTFTVGSSTRRINKIVVVANCGGKRETFVKRNVPIKDNGIFRYVGGGYVSVVGIFRSQDRVTGSLTTNQCGFFGGDYSATD